MSACEKCGGAGWVWGFELHNPSSDTLNDTMTKYRCDECDECDEDAETFETS